MSSMTPGQAETRREFGRPLLAALLMCGMALPMLSAAAVPTGPAEPQATPATVAGDPATDAARAAAGGVPHFGFYASAMGHWNFTAELAPWTTLTWIHVGRGEGPVDGARRIVDRVREARDHGVQAVLSLEPFLFADDRGAPRDAAEVDTFLVELRARLEVEDLVGTVAMLYPKDEPFREFRRARDPDFVEEYVTGEVYDDIYADLERVLEPLQVAFPEIPRGVILSGLELHHRFFRIPERYDWVGFSCYANLFDACEGRSFVQLYGRLLANMTSTQRLMAVPETWALSGDTARDDWPETLTRRLRHHWEMVMAEPRFVAVIPFLWSFDAPTATPGIGLDRFPATWDEGTAGAGTAFLEAVLDIGRQVRDGSAAYPDLAWSETEDHPARPDATEEGRILAIGTDGLVRVQALDRALPHKNLRVQLRLLDDDGRLLASSPRVRTDEALPLAVRDWPEDGLLLGTHGYSWQIPAPLLGGHAGRALEIELLTWADGLDGVIAHRTVRPFTPAPDPAWPFRYDGVLFHPDLWNADREQPGPVFGPRGHGTPAGG